MTAERETAASAPLAGRIALVTGGTGGIGTAICARLAREGATVIATDRQRPKGDLPDGVRFCHTDITDDASIRATISTLEAEFGKIHILVNAAGIEIEKTIEDTSLEEWNHIFAVNVTGTFLVSKHALNLMRNAGGGSIINFGSYDGFIADPGLAAYCATKGAVHALTRAMACDYGPEGIRVNAICPGYIDTPMLQSFFGDSGDIESLQQAVRDVHPMRRYGTPDDVAGLVNWLAGDEARYASGQLWVLDGGLTAQVQQMRF
ncbi:SDR family NAD(P)-dependent oxidoreductase [Alphaproteobacteria bacterium LSUCC0684]